jgi:hypothetical protein
MDERASGSAARAAIRADGICSNPRQVKVTPKVWWKTGDHAALLPASGLEPGGWDLYNCTGIAEAAMSETFAPRAA